MRALNAKDTVNRIKEILGYDIPHYQRLAIIKKELGDYESTP